MYGLAQILRDCSLAERRSHVIHALQLDNLPWQSPVRLPTFDDLVSADYLHTIARYIKAVGGPGPGPDRVRLADLSRTELWRLASDLNRLLQEESFLPSRARIKRRKKPSGGFRVLKLRSVSTRIVATALHFGFSPYLESIFLPCSYGFRRHLGTWHMLRDLQREIEEQGFTIIAQADIVKAFDNVRHDLVLQDFRRHPIEERALRLIDTILNKERHGNAIGYDQGCSWSPNALNTHLHHRLDGHPTAEPDRCWCPRYADNLFAAAHSSSRGRTFIQTATAILEELGLRLHTTPVTDLQAGETAEVLGLGLGIRGGQVTFQTTTKAWRHLEDALVELWGKATPIHRAKDVTRGWIGHMGPALEIGSKEMPRRIVGLAARAGIYEIAPEEIETWCAKSRERWVRFKEGQQPIQRDEAGGGGMAFGHARFF